MTTYLERRWGGGGKNPTIPEMVQAIEELREPDEEHPDCWLSDENGWTIAAHQGGKVVLENSESGEGPWHLLNQPPAHILELWSLLQKSDLSQLRQKEWRAGYGPC